MRDISARSFEVLDRVYEDYKPAEIIISENGSSYSDGPDAESRVHDKKRIHYLREHLLAVWQVIESGIPVTGYYAWSLMDNFIAPPDVHVLQELPGFTSRGPNGSLFL